MPVVPVLLNSIEQIYREAGVLTLFETNKNESSICSMLIANFRQEMKIKTEQIKEERQIALNNIIDSINIDLSRQYSQRLSEVSKKSGLNDNEKLLRAEFEFIKSEYNGLRKVCN